MRADYILDKDGPYVIVERPEWKDIPHRFFHNSTYNETYCVVLSNNWSSVHDAFGDGKGHRNYADETYAATWEWKANVEFNGVTMSRPVIFIVLNPEDNMFKRISVGGLLHEMYHVLRMTFDHKGETDEGLEQGSYLIDWLIDEVYMILFGQKFVEKKDWEKNLTASIIFQDSDKTA